MKVIFHHVPKAAGSTFSASLYCHYNPDEVFRVSAKTKFERLSMLQELPQEKRSRLNLLLSHMPFGAHRIVGEDWRYYSIVRDPVKRAVSLYRYILSEPTHYLNEQCRNAGSIKEFLTLPEAKEMRNEMTRYFLYPEQMNEDETVEAHHLELAIQNIEQHFPSVGLLERYDDSIVLFSKIFKHSPLYYFRLNKTSGTPNKLSELDIAELTQANSIDVKLYEYLKNRFEQQLVAQNVQIPDDVEQFKRRNNCFGKFLFLLRVFTYKFKQKLL